MPKPSSKRSPSVRPIRTEPDYESALAEIDALFEAGPDTPEGDRLEVLTTLVDAYEQKHHASLPPDPIDALLYHVESRGLTRTDLEAYLGSPARVAEILDRRRSLTIEMIRRLYQGLGLPAEILIRSYPLQRRSA